MNLPDRIEAKIERIPFSGCWIWTGATLRGYGRISLKGENRIAHRVIYEFLRGPIPLPELDHLCRVRCCVNPDHLEPVTKRENRMRGFGVFATNARAAKCRNGHDYDLIVSHPSEPPHRRCSICIAQWRKTAYARYCEKIGRGS